MDYHTVTVTEHLQQGVSESAKCGEFVELIDLLSSTAVEFDEFRSFVDNNSIVNFKCQRSKKSISNKKFSWPRAGQ